MDVDPSDFNQALPDAVLVPHARDDLDIADASPIPYYRETRALGQR